MIQAARVDPNGMVRFMRGLGRRHAGMPQVVSYLSTHPHNSERVAMLEQLASEARYAPVPLMPASAWARTREACKDA
jgi:predicted Zn-dependent protease